MTSYICEASGTRFAPSAQPPANRPVCEDERPYVGWRGQRWTTHEALGESHALRVGDDAGLFAPAMASELGIAQRALPLNTKAGNLLRECPSLVTDEAVPS